MVRNVDQRNDVKYHIGTYVHNSFYGEEAMIVGMRDRKEEPWFFRAFGITGKAARGGRADVTWYEVLLSTD